jgi:hypothetical protein
MMKKLWLVLLAVVLVFGLAMLGCGSKNDDPPPPPPPGGDGEGANVLEVTFGEEWSGIDLLNSKFTFATGDKIAAKGKIIAVGGSGAEFVFNDKPGAWGVPLFQKSGIVAGTEWDFDTALTATMITNITAASPSGIRIGGNNVTANTLKVVFEQIKITRGETVLLDLAEHLQTFNVDDSNMDLILPGAMGFQKAGTVTVKIIEK